MVYFDGLNNRDFTGESMYEDRYVQDRHNDLDKQIHLCREIESTHYRQLNDKIKEEYAKLYNDLFKEKTKIYNVREYLRLPWYVRLFKSYTKYEKETIGR